MGNIFVSSFFCFSQNGFRFFRYNSICRHDTASEHQHSTKNQSKTFQNILFRYTSSFSLIINGGYPISL